VELVDDWAELLRAEAADYAQVALTNIRREFPSGVYHDMTAPGDFPFRPKARTPAFYGSYDWHSCVEMHWLLLRLLRVAGDVVPAKEIKSVLNAHFRPMALAAEVEFVTSKDGLWERPYGWAWALALALDWLPKATYPVRYGVHYNSAFGMSRALDHAHALARAGNRALLDAITAKAYDWFGGDTMYPGAWEPSGHDFLSPALCEAELMAKILPEGEFGFWLAMFLPGIAGGEPAALFTPAVVSDVADGQIAHLHGLNASRAWCWRRIAESLPAGDPRIGPAVAAARTHAGAALPHVVGDDYTVEHWLACYAVLMLS